MGAIILTMAVRFLRALGACDACLAPTEVERRG